MSWEHVPGYVSERESFGETTVTVEREQLLEAALHMRDVEGFNMLSDVSPADYLGWGEAGVAGYWGSVAGRDTNAPGSWGLARTPAAKPGRFSVSYHLLAIPRARPRFACSFGARTASPSRASCPSGRPPTGTNARPST